VVVVAAVVAAVLMVAAVQVDSLLIQTYRCSVVLLM
jgi:hypothetical protein